SGSSWSQVQKVLGCSRGTISSAIKRKSGLKSSS
ncbi:resolvase, partial [Escherichia coli]|nr:resolvase [Escherichia coli]